jgi:hypothetical protein
MAETDDIDDVSADEAEADLGLNEVRSVSGSGRFGTIGSPEQGASMSKITAYNKFIVAAVGLVVTLGYLDAGTAQNIGGVLTALSVWLFPNE